MGSRTRPNCDEPTTALRQRSSARLLADLTAFMGAVEPEVAIDFRDVLVGFAPFYDCAIRLGIDPIQLFESAARDRGAPLRELATTFARRSDITLAAFGWQLVDRAGGPCYRRA